MRVPRPDAETLRVMDHSVHLLAAPPELTPAPEGALPLTDRPHGPFVPQRTLTFYLLLTLQQSKKWLNHVLMVADAGEKRAKRGHPSADPTAGLFPARHRRAAAKTTGAGSFLPVLTHNPQRLPRLFPLSRRMGNRDVQRLLTFPDPIRAGCPAFHAAFWPEELCQHPENCRTPFCTLARQSAAGVSIVSSAWPGDPESLHAFVTNSRVRRDPARQPQDCGALAA